MFFRRKPKTKPDGEEPLVPHGLIWQATAQEEPPAASAAVSSPALNHPQPTTDARFNRPPSPRKLGAISPPIAWPSPRIQEIPRRPHSRAETERVAAMAMSQVIPVPLPEEPHVSRLVVPKIESSRPQLVEARQTLAVPSPPPKTHTPFRERFPALRKRLHALEKSWAITREELGGNVRALIANLRQRIQVTREALSTQFHRALAWPRSLKSPLHAIIATSAAAKPKLLSRFQALWRRVEVGFGRSAGAMSGVWQSKIRLGFHFAWSRPMESLKASVSGWKSKAFRLKFDSRLWTSMAMAGASAGLALGMISVVRHYSPEATPVRSRSFRPPASPVKHLKGHNSVSHPSVGTRPIVDKPGAARSATHPSRIETPAKSPKLSARRVQARKPRPRNSEDADYVARDTYVYYGTNGKNGR